MYLYTFLGFIRSLNSSPLNKINREKKLELDEQIH